MTRIISVVSGKGGVGKTTVTANIGVAMASKFNKKVILVDADIDMATLGLVLGMPQSPITLQDVLKGEANPEDALYPGPGGIKFMPASIATGKLKTIDPEKFKKIILDISVLADIILIDCGAGAHENVLSALAVSSEALPVINPDNLSVTNGFKITREAIDLDNKIIGIVLNKVIGDKTEIKDSEIESLFGVKILGKIPLSKAVHRSVIEGKPLVIKEPYHPVSIEFKKIAAKILGVEYIPEKPPKKGFLDKLFSIFKRN